LQELKQIKAALIAAFFMMKQKTRLSISFSSAANQTLSIHVQKYFDVNHRKMAYRRQPTTTKTQSCSSF
jgi:hypothetical protein